MKVREKNKLKSGTRNVGEFTLNGIFESADKKMKLSEISNKKHLKMKQAIKVYGTSEPISMNHRHETRS
jgi:hypothetical protein